MTEFWVANKRYLCKYCNIFIGDDAPSRQHHENGLRHKGNMERYIRGIYKTSEKKVKDAAEEQRAMAQVERAAQAAFAADVSAGLAKAAGPASSSSSGSKPEAGPARPGDKYANYSTPASLGYSDPDSEQPNVKQDAGTVGEWQAVEPTRTVTTAGTKREAETPVDEEEGRSFKLRKKTLGTGLGEIYDPGIIIRPSEGSVVKSESPPPSTTVKSEESDVPPPSLFKKRKAKGTAGKRREVTDTK